MTLNLIRKFRLPSAVLLFSAFSYYVYWRKYCKSHKQTKSLSTFPNELLLEILNRLPLRDLIGTLPLINKRLGLLSQHVLDRRTQLSLVGVIGEDGNYSSLIPLTFQEIEFKLNANTCAKIAQTFPNVRKLKFTITGVIGLESAKTHAETLLSHFVDHLECLNLIILFEHFNEVIVQNANAFRDILSVVNRMSTLRQLIVDAEYVWLGSSIDLPIISNLDDFSFTSFDETKILYESLIKYAVPNRKLKRISLGTFTASEDSLVNLIQNSSRRTFDENENEIIQNREFTSKFSKIVFYGAPLTDLERLGDVFQLLTNLTTLHLVWEYWHFFTHLIKALVPLTKDVTHSKLAHLKIGFYAGDFPHADLLDLSELVESKCQLHSIKSLYLEASIISHDEIRLLHFDKICPNVESVDGYLNFPQCTVCGNLGKDNSQCRQLMLDGFYKMDSKPKISVVFEK